MKKAGILGGGQLGRMLLQAAVNYPVETFVLENDTGCPAAHLCNHFIKGDIRNYDDVYNFGKGLDVLTIEIESVNDAALERLEQEGVKIFPKPAALRVIRNKILQKQFYAGHNIPTAPFRVTNTKEEIKQYPSLFPAVHKIAVGGYDGRGVVSLKSLNDFSAGFDAPAVLEKKVDIRKEIAVIIAANDRNEVAIYPAVDMVFDPVLHLLDYQLTPVDADREVLWKAEALALKVVRDLASPGIFAIEMFIDTNSNVWVNETAPRVHNSGHHTIEANYCSQFDMLWRVLLDYPLGNTTPISSSAMVNIVGSEGFSGSVVYEGLEEVLKIENAFVHLYGKAETRPGRKMGHVTIISNSPHDLTYKAHLINTTLKAKA